MNVMSVLYVFGVIRTPLYGMLQVVSNTVRMVSTRGNPFTITVPFTILQSLSMSLNKSQVTNAMIRMLEKFLMLTGDM